MCKFDNRQANRCEIKTLESVIPVNRRSLYNKQTLLLDVMKNITHAEGNLDIKKAHCLRAAISSRTRINLNPSTNKRGLVTLNGDFQTHPIDWILVRNLESFHCTNKSVHGQVDVLVDQFDKTASLLIRISRSMDDAHLLDEGALA